MKASGVEQNKRHQYKRYVRIERAAIGRKALTTLDVRSLISAHCILHQISVRNGDVLGYAKANT